MKLGTPISCAPILLSLFIMGGCGSSSFVLLDIFASCGAAEEACLIPAEIDKIEVRVFTPDVDLSTEIPGPGQVGHLAQEELLLKPEDTFPLSVLLEPSETTPKELQEVINVFLGDSCLQSIAVKHPWESGRVNKASIAITVPPNGTCSLQ